MSTLRSTRSPTMNRSPATTSSRNPVRGGGAVSVTLMEAMNAAATTKVAASTTATSQPPAVAKIAAPTNGPKSRNPSLNVARLELASTRSSSGSSSFSSPFTAAGSTTNETPYRNATAQISQTSPSSRTSASGSTAAALARLPQTRIGLRGSRSIQTPNSGAPSAGSTMKKNVRPAIALESVSVFTHMLSTSSITESPSIDVLSPAKRRGNPGLANSFLTPGPPRGSTSAHPTPRTRRAGHPDGR